jgi:hypothetical protein
MRTATISAAEGPIAPTAPHYLGITRLGLKFDPTAVCEMHQELPKFEALSEMVKKREQQIDTVEELLHKYKAQPVLVPIHFCSDPGDWEQFGEGPCVSWIAYCDEQVRLCKDIYKADLSRGRQCVGCFVEWPYHLIHPTWALADAILKDIPPDVSPFEPEVGILLMDAWAFHRGEKCTYWDLPDFSDDDGEETP